MRNLAAPERCALALLLFLLVAPVFTYFVSPLLANLSRAATVPGRRLRLRAGQRRPRRRAAQAARDNAATLTPDPVYVKFYHSHPPASNGSPMHVAAWVLPLPSLDLDQGWWSPATAGTTPSRTPGARLRAPARRKNECVVGDRVRWMPTSRATA